MFLKKKEEKKIFEQNQRQSLWFLFIFFKFLHWPYFQSFSVAMTYRERNSKKEQAEHRTVTIRQIWIASKGVRVTLTAHTLHAFATSKQTPIARDPPIIVRLRGLNRAVEHQKYELRDDTVSKAVIRPRSNVETINPIPVNRINDMFSFLSTTTKKTRSFRVRLSSRILRFLIALIGASRFL